MSDDAKLSYVTREQQEKFANAIPVMHLSQILPPCSCLFSTPIALQTITELSFWK